MSIPTNAQYSTNDLEFLTWFYNYELQINNQSINSNLMVNLNSIIKKLNSGLFSDLSDIDFYLSLYNIERLVNNVPSTFKIMLRLKGIINNIILVGRIDNKSESGTATVNLEEESCLNSIPNFNNFFYPNFNGNLFASIYLASGTLNDITVSSNQWDSPDGNKNGEIITDTVTNIRHYVSINANFVNGGIYELSCYASKNTASIIQFCCSSLVIDTSLYANFNLNTGKAVSTLSYDIFNIYSNVYLCKAYFTSTVTSSGTAIFALTNDLSNNGRLPIYVGNLKSVNVWGAKLVRVS